MSGGQGEGQTPPGWYQTAHGDVQWWDGQAWQGQNGPPQTAAPVVPPAQPGYPPAQPGFPPAQPGYPPAQPGYGAPPFATGVAAPTYQRTGGLATAAQVLFGVIAALLALSAIQGMSLTDDLDSVSLFELQDKADALDGTRVLSFIAGLALAIVLAIWCSSMTKNLDGPLGSPGMRFRSGMAAGGWFIPLANLVIPGMVLNETWKASSPSSAAGTDQWRQEKTSPLVIAWWVGFVGWFLGWFWVASHGPTEDGFYTVDDIKGLIGAHNLWSAFGAIAAIVGLFMVRDIARRHSERARTLGVATD